ALAEFFPGSSPGDGDLYLNPTVKSSLPSPGGSLPLGGSTGGLIPLANDLPLTVTIRYQGSIGPEATTASVSHLVSANDPMPLTPSPDNVVNTFSVVSAGQDGTGQSYERGFVHLVVAAPPGVSFIEATFSQVIWELSDPVGLYWDSTPNSLGHNHIDATFRNGS